MKRVALYMRVSSDLQAKEGDSIPAQRDALTKYAINKGYTIAGEYLDDGISGTKYSQRDELQRMLSDVQAGKIDMIIFTKLDRFFRSVRHYTATQAILDKCGVGWLAIWETIYDTTTPQGRLIVNQMMSVAQFEAENTGQRVRQIQAYKLSKKEVISGTTTAGYMIVDKHLVPDENAPYVRRAFEMYSAVGSINEVMREYGGRYGMPTSKPAFRRMLKSPLYKGEHYSGVKDFCPAIVPSDLWDDVQRKLTINIKCNQKQVYLFSGLIRCAECGRVFGSNTRRRKRGNCITVTHQYRCTGYYARFPRQCTNPKVVAESMMERYLIEHIQPMIKDKILEYEIAEKEIPSRIPDMIARTEKKLDRLKVLYIDGLIDLTAYKADRAALQDELIDLQGKAQKRHTADSTALKRLLAPDVWQLYKTFSPEEKRRFWRGIISRINFSADRTVEVVFL